ncbi:inhibitor of nuclear factor kappa-B kinase subunit epsilon [Tachysurus fulvidraco]|uniref:inhibitor of nuclear factor kappa-B kinase subunit epsilon n=1 Tax=Tachysurus fulvidraco TaxID=1234273 RepID=UPI000F4F297E|nr:inhibitor of nuclear factor kappa-B kinase subunit epsilon [Tachysurus fulvidraco]XP_047661337.1 inhibitor of nuclear factor kappa-B kinase subunit epsilon [Tachysurus fulvidraco]
MTTSTENHLWSTEDILGQGATASVFKARTKKTSEVVAVKVFNMASYSRPYEVQMREFELLRRLNHVNIVKLLSIEEIQANPKQKVLVMEYCSGGSLLNQLEEPENAFGLPESEFLIVLQCVAQGMNHLRENGVIHRDIKPGNILRQVGEDGGSVYKLTDFGAARELEDDEKFVSIYGTEEYLHPDMYEHAVLRKPQQKAYGVTVDLWSIGVTFYHIATGSLPFIPYGGPRRNKQIMYKITTEKPNGAIAGVQKVDNGPIEWSFGLPHSCQVSEGLKMHLVPVLANILEVNQEKCWEFDQFFAATLDILQRVKVHVFSLQQATAHTIYIHFYNTVAVFFEEVQAQTGIGAEMQQYLFQGHLLMLEPSMKVINLPPTSAERPVFLLSRRAEKIAALPPREPETPALPSRFDIVADHTFSKNLVGVIHQFLRTTRLLHKHIDLILQGFYGYIEIVRTECNTTTHKIALVNMKLLSCLNTEETLDALTQVPVDVPISSDNMQKLRLIHEKLPVYGNGLREIQDKLQNLHLEIGKHSKTHSQDRCIQKMEVLLEKILAVHRQYRKDKHTGKLNYNDEQIHKFEKINLSVYIKKVKALFRDECLQRYQEVLAAVVTWSSVLSDIQSKLEHFSSFFLQLIGDLQMCEGEQTKVLDRALVIALQRPAGAGANDGMKSRENMILRMKRLRDEMEKVARELQNNNQIIESLRVFNSTLVLEPNLPQQQGS